MTDLDVLKRDRAALALAFYRNDLSERPFTFEGVGYAIDITSLSRIRAMGNRALRPGFSVQWIAADGSPVEMNAEKAKAFAEAANRYAADCVARLRAIQAAIGAAADTDAIEAIDISGGYPAAS